MNSSVINNSSSKDSKVKSRIVPKSFEKAYKLKLPKSVSNNNSRNRTKNEISTLSDLTNSINRGNSRDSTSRKKPINAIVKPQQNISFSKNITNLMASLDSISNSQNNTLKKSRNVGSYIKSHKTTQNSQKTIFKTVSVNPVSKSRNSKSLYAVHQMDSLSKTNTYDKDQTIFRDSSLNTKINKTRNVASDKKNYLKPSKTREVHEYNLRTMNLGLDKTFEPKEKSLIINRHESKEGSNTNISNGSSNFFNLKQKISNLKFGISKLKPGKRYLIF